MLYTNQEITKRKKIENRVNKFVNILIYSILIIVMIYNLSLIIQSILKPNQTPSFLGLKTYVIISGSMEPNINIGDLVVVQKTKGELKEGDIISYRKGHSVITHRISQKTENEEGEIIYKTKGDNNNTEDSEEIRKEEIEGKVIKVIPKIGNVTLVLKNKVVATVVVIILSIYIIKNYKKNKKLNSRHKKRMEYEENKR